MSGLLPPTFLRRALLADALVSGATGLLLASGAGVLGELLGLPVALLRVSGLILLPYAALVWMLSQRSLPARAAVWAVIVCNLLWAVDSVLLLFVGPVAPTSLGVAFVVAQATVVALFAELQYFGLRRAATVAA